MTKFSSKGAQFHTIRIRPQKEAATVDQYNPKNVGAYTSVMCG